MEKESVIVTVGKEEKKQVELVKLEMDGIEWEAGNLSQKEPDIDTIFKEYEQLMDNETEFDIKFATARIRAPFKKFGFLPELVLFSDI